MPLREMLGKSLAELDFRKKYNAMVLLLIGKGHDFAVGRYGYK